MIGHRPSLAEGWSKLLKPPAIPSRSRCTRALTTPSTASCQYATLPSESMLILRPAEGQPPAATPRPGPTRSTRWRASSTDTPSKEGTKDLGRHGELGSDLP